MIKFQFNTVLIISLFSFLSCTLCDNLKKEIKKEWKYDKKVNQFEITKTLYLNLRANQDSCLNGMDTSEVKKIFGSPTKSKFIYGTTFLFYYNLKQNDSLKFNHSLLIAFDTKGHLKQIALDTEYKMPMNPLNTN